MRIKLVLISLLTAFTLLLPVMFALAPASPAHADFTWNENPSSLFPMPPGLIPDQAYVIKDNVNYKLYYAGNDFASINLAQSPDGITWTPYSGNPIISDAQYHSDVKYYNTGFPGANSGTNPSALTMNYRMWYQGPAGLTIEGWRYAESPDGISWYNRMAVSQFGTPVLGANISAQYGIANAVYTPGASNTGTDWTFRIYVNAQYAVAPYSSNELVVLAFSSNGYNWTGYDPTSAGYATPVFTPSLDPARFDCDHIGWFKVIKNSPTDWEAFYSGGKDSTYQALNGIGYATSPDGINWTRVKTLCTTADGVAWRSQSVWMPSVVKIGSNYRIWFIGSDNPNIGSSDWIQWRLGGASAISVPLRLTATGSPNPASVAATVNFTAAPTGGFPSYTYDWDFGDGSAHGNVQNPSHTYSVPGVYTVRVMVTDDIGNTAKDTITMSIVYSAVGSGASPSHGAGMGYSGLASRPFQPVELPNLSVQSASLSSTTVEPNTPVTLTALVGNKSTVNGAKNIKVYVNGQEETSTGVTINSGETRTMTFSVSRSQPGTYTVYVDSTPAGSFTVKDSTGTVLLVLSAAALLAALLGLVYLARRRQG